MEDSVTDASDWPTSEMREFDRKLRCPICQDFFRTAVMLKNCSHNFCSLCIRRSLALNTECPVCRKMAATTDLEVNRILDELVLNFSIVRPQLLSYTIIIQQEKSLGLGPSDFPGSPQSSSSSSLLQSNQKRQSKRKNLKPELDNNVVPPVQGNISCPVCQGQFSLDRIEGHVDLCLLKGTNGSSSGQVQDPPPPPTKSKPMKKINKPVYNLLKDNDIKKLLVELELPITGEREEWIRRHSEFLLLYNAECDSINPKSIAQIKTELRNLERARNRKSFTVDLGDENSFTEAAAQYRKKNEDHFKELISRVKRPPNTS